MTPQITNHSISKRYYVVDIITAEWFSTVKSLFATSLLVFFLGGGVEGEKAFIKDSIYNILCKYGKV